MIGTIIGAVVLLVVGLFVFSLYAQRETVTATVFDKERVCDSTDSSSSCKYLIYSEAGTFELTDSLLANVRFNSSDMYGRIKRCHRYAITSYGWRMPVFSMYPNIVEIEDQGKDDECSE